MPNIYNVLVLTGLCLPGIVLMSQYSVRALADKPDNKLSDTSLFAAVATQTLVIVALCAAAGVYLGRGVGIRDLVLEGAARGEAQWSDLYRQLKAGALSGVLCAGAWMIAYYGFVRSRLDEETVAISERLRNRLSLWTRITSGGIVEEVIFRWGALTVAMWALSAINLGESASWWIGIAVTGIVFGLAHLPVNLQEGCKPSPLFIGTSIVGNLWVSLICGYLLYRYGLIAAMTVHVLFHVIWYPWDMSVHRRMEACGSASRNSGDGDGIS
ncbi:CPBP family intramembrane glutamic endopeptidase [Cohnella cholangitidis]|uniref:CPBP family intramembrane metalloprotease n=1 Tax=Cohnella cholangitidis TaxID=2598458 RepID=A0A7G5C0M5_9BACL|nr:CPBP family intramembrane glutamic endopeptidase [Cohnella cholangitidis]QMV42759.1 CPBP family intramembrane metalloprotease [Cohnella cholangitidis]